MGMGRLTREQIADIAALLTSGKDLPEDYKHVLFPPEKKEYELVYANKNRVEDILAQTWAVPLQPIKTFGGERKPDSWTNRLIFGDNLQVMKRLLDDPKVKGQVRLVYIDPPFATKQDFQGSQDQKAYQDKIAGAEFIEFLRKRFVLLRELLAPNGSIYVHLDWRKVHYIKVVLDELFGEHNFINQIIWQRHDPHNDSVSRYGRIHDTILWYSKGQAPVYNYAEIAESLSPAAIHEYNLAVTHKGNIVPWSESLSEPHWRFKLDDCTVKGMDRKRQFDWRGADGSDKRVWPAASPAEMDKLVRECTRYLQSGRKAERPPLLLYLRDPKKGAKRCRVSFLEERQEEGQLAQDIWLRLGRMKGGSSYPTEKPEVLLDRIIRASSNEGDIVLDAFAGSGTTLAVAEKLRRRWIGVDCGKLAAYTIQKRMLRLTEEVGGKGKSLAPKPFTLYNAGLYDLARVRELPWEDYRLFAIQLFQIKDEPHKISGIPLDGYKGASDALIFNFKAKQGVQLDEDYIDELHRHLGEKVRREFFIVAPAACVTFLEDYVIRGNTRYYILRIPYSIIDELHDRPFQEIRQPVDEAHVNDTVDAVGFDFITPPTLKTKYYTRRKSGELFAQACIKIERFQSEAMTKHPREFKDKETLSLVMIDYDYKGNGEGIFDLDQVFYRDQIEAAGWEIALEPQRLGLKTMIIYIDIFGNEFREVKSPSDFGLKVPGKSSKAKAVVGH